MKTTLIIAALFLFSSANLSAQNSDVQLNTQGKYVNSAGEFLTGSLEFFYATGQKESFYEVSNGIKDGQMIVYNINGTTKEIGSFNNGLKVGEWRSYNDKGVLESLYKLV